MNKVELRKILVAAICEALPYDPILCNVWINNGLPQRVYAGYLGLGKYIEGYSIEDTTFDYAIDNTKILIRPMSDMTDEEHRYLLIKCNTLAKQIDFYNKRHLDYRGLVELGIGVPVTKERYHL